MQVRDPLGTSGGGGVIFADRRSPSPEHRRIALGHVLSWLALDAFVIATAVVLYLAARSLG
jgi:hypothetical protein